MARNYTDIYLGRPGALGASGGERQRDNPVIDPQVIPPLGTRMRLAGDQLLEAVNPFTMSGGKPTGLRVGRVAGAGTLLSLLAAANELSDPNDSAGRNLAEAAGVGLGGLGGGLGGAAIGQALIPIPGVGALVGATIGGMLGQGAGKTSANALLDVLEGSPESRAIRNQQAVARAAAESEAERMRMLMPLQEQASQLALRNRASMAEIENDQMLRQAIAQGLLAQAQGGAQQNIAMTNAILGG